LIEKTGGNFGFGLAVCAKKYNLKIDLAVGLSFSKIKRKTLEYLGANLIGISMMKEGKSPKEVVMWHLENAKHLNKNYYYTDQFDNRLSIKAHEYETGLEIVHNITNKYPHLKEITFVSCAGTGASLMGIQYALKNYGYNTKVILVEPKGCCSEQNIFVDHVMEGMSVGVSPPFIDWNLISDVITVSESDMLDVRKEIAQEKGLFLGNTSAACLAVAKNIAKQDEIIGNNNHKILTIGYDSAYWYL